jgi:hypothetical protein
MIAQNVLRVKKIVSASDTLAAIERADFRVEWCRAFRFPPFERLSPLAPRILGVARR